MKCGLGGLPHEQLHQEAKSYMRSGIPLGTNQLIANEIYSTENGCKVEFIVKISLAILILRLRELGSGRP